jgi:predicted helicase
MERKKRNDGILANKLAHYARFMRDNVILKLLNDPPRNTGSDPNPDKELYKILEALSVPGMTKEDLAGIYSKALTFGIFTAYVRCGETLSRKKIIRYLPEKGVVMYELIKYISRGKIPDDLKFTIDRILEILEEAREKGLIEKIAEKRKDNDPLNDFYELFLNHFNQDMGEKKGVCFTPAPVVSFIVRSIHHLLKTSLNKPLGIADPLVKILDPAAGTSTFLSETARLAIDTFSLKLGEGFRVQYTRQVLLNKLYGFEIMLSEYSISHLRLTLLIAGQPPPLCTDERFNIFLTDTLDMKEITKTPSYGMKSLSIEAKLADVIKNKMKIDVLVGNPPYPGYPTTPPKPGKGMDGYAETQRKTQWIREKLEDYKKVDGFEIDERNLYKLHYDYVKFIRFAQHKIQEKKEGIIGFITDNEYLYDPGFRGMRKSLLETFDMIYILNLHGKGSAGEKESPAKPGGIRDENVFDIRHGAAISFFVKKKKSNNTKTGCTVYYAEITGGRDHKYRTLREKDIESIQWTEISAEWDEFLFVPGNRRNIEREDNPYFTFIKITSIFHSRFVGIVTARDKLSIHRSEEQAYDMIKQFSRMGVEEARKIFELGADTRDWSIRKAQEDIIESGTDRNKIVPIHYRPFDIRYTYYTGNSRGFHGMPRPEGMKHILKRGKKGSGNIGIVTVKQASEGIFNHVIVTQNIIDSRLATSPRGASFLFPLYLDTVNTKGIQKRIPNIPVEFSRMLIQKAGFETPPKPEQIFYYIYAVLYSTIYREKYADYLRIDFPRIPVTKDRELFMEMSELGKALAQIHLMESPEISETESKFEKEGDNIVKEYSYSGESKRVYIDKDQYFSKIDKEVWDYEMCGYKVLQKYLKTRKGIALSASEIFHFIQLVRIIQLTIRYQKMIDEKYPLIEQTIGKINEK